MLGLMALGTEVCVCAFVLLLTNQKEQIKKTRIKIEKYEGKVMFLNKRTESESIHYETIKTRREKEIYLPFTMMIEMCDAFITHATVFCS